MFNTLRNIKMASARQLESGCYLVLLNPQHKPPHLGLLAAGNWYSLTHRRAEIGDSFQEMNQRLVRKEIPGLYIRVDVHVDQDMLALANHTFGQYSKAGSGISCLVPLRALLAEITGRPYQKAQFVFELVPMLHADGKILEVFHQNLERWMKNHTFTLQTYTAEEIQKRITTLNQEHPASIG